MGIRAERAGEVDLFDLHRRDPQRYPFLLQSVAGHPVSGRYDLLFGFPGASISGAGFFERLDAAYTAERLHAHDDGDLPFVGGWFLLLGYEATRQIEPRLRLPASPHQLPDALAVRCSAVAIYDRERRVTTVYAEAEHEQLSAMLADLDAPPPPPETEPDIGAAVEDDAGRYLAGVRRILAYLQIGRAHV